MFISEHEEAKLLRESDQLVASLNRFQIAPNDPETVARTKAMLLRASENQDRLAARLNAMFKGVEK